MSIEETAAVLRRPQAQLTELCFQDGARLSINSGEIIVFVGPNNAGKSAVLKEIYGVLEAGKRSTLTILRSATFGYSGSGQLLEEWLASTAKREPNGMYSLPLVGRFSPGQGFGYWQGREESGWLGLTGLFATHLITEARLNAVGPTNSINFVEQPSTHPFHLLYEDDALEATMDAVFQRAFRTNLVVNRGAGSHVMLHVGRRPDVAVGKDRLSTEYRRAVNEMPLLHQQGDGMRAFGTIITNVLVADRDVVFLDEPEAFLHPPQALLLGEILAESTPPDKQLVIATHSIDVLRGLIEKSSSRVRVIGLLGRAIALTCGSLRLMQLGSFGLTRYCASLGYWMGCFTMES